MHKKQNLKGEKVTRQKKIKQNQCAFLGPIFNKFLQTVELGNWEVYSLFWGLRLGLRMDFSVCPVLRPSLVCCPFDHLIMISALARNCYNLSFLFFGENID